MKRGIEVEKTTRKFKYNYIHRFRDDQGVYFIVSNSRDKPNKNKVKFKPFGNVPTKYLGIINRSDVDERELELMDAWVNKHGTIEKPMFYMPMADVNITFVNIDE
jgi:hypothetical protein|tara:strand:- start:12 stop:326 length:315 start_codon:yes stop_codon:yes gene_type:complete